MIARGQIREARIKRDEALPRLLPHHSTQFTQLLLTVRFAHGRRRGQHTLGQQVTRRISNPRHSDYLRQALQATFASSLSAPLPADLLKLLHALDKPQDSGRCA